MSGKAHGNLMIGGDKRTRDRVNKRNPRKDKKGGRKRSHKHLKKIVMITENRVLWEKELKELCRQCPKRGNCKACDYSRIIKKGRNKKNI